ncbi:hypothetical protein [Flocculibacter collagenilyticus]|uniref:hypothetical protein n=1 Tax=Flocculibacter collagenilyticus TaxID=2744479 RepID=UPI0018F4F8B0|nr:hypothetical protein [Flocculibacter collagenilyticus]
MIDKLITALGKSYSDPLLSDALSVLEVDISNELILPDNEYRVYVERPDYGLALTFTDGRVFTGAKASNELYFSGLFIYSSGVDDYSQFEGNLPANIDFLHSHRDLVKKFGEPTVNLWIIKSRALFIAEAFFEHSKLY